jgi:PAS domain S-box-containing protein
LRILIVDDHDGVRQGVRSLLSTHPGWQVCGEASNGIEAVEKAKSLRPDIVLMDISMPRMDGLKATTIIRQEVPESDVFIISQNDPTLMLSNAAKMGARGYIAKSNLVRDLFPALEKAESDRGGTDLQQAQETTLRFEQEHLRESEERLRLAQRVALVGTFEWNIKTGVNRWTPELEAMYGLPPGGFPGTQAAWEQLVHPEDREAAVSNIERAIKEGSFEGEWRVIWPNGSVRWLLGRAWIFKDHSGEPERLIGVNIDVTDRKQDEQTLRESEERFRAIVETTPECVKLVAGDGTLLHMNPSGLTMVGADCAEMVVGRNVYDLIATHDRERFRAFNERICSGERGSLQFDIVGLQGVTRHMETHAAPLRMSGGNVVQLAVTSDITERTRAEEELRRGEERLRIVADGLETQVQLRTQELEERNAKVLQQSEQLRELSNRLLQTQDDERRHIARELHDSAGQTVAILGMNLASLGQQVEDNAALGKVVADCQNLVQELSKELRTTSYLLHPPLLDESGLSEAIRWYIQGLTERSDLSIGLAISENFGRLPRDIELTLFRIAQECLTNIHRHSGSKTAVIRLSQSAGNVSLEIQDDGMGIPAEKQARIQLQGSGVGITGMRERVRHFKGAMDIESSDSGTKVSVLLPVTIPRAAEAESTPPGTSVP